MINKMILFLFLMLVFSLDIISCYENQLILGLNFENYKNQNQTTLSIFKKEGLEYEGLDDMSIFKISVGLKTFSDNNPEFIYNIAIVDGDNYFPVFFEKIDFKSRPLTPGVPVYSLWNYLLGATFLNFDKTNYEKFIINWIKFRAGFGFNTYELEKYNKNNFNGFLSAGIGLSSIELGNYNFENIINNTKLSLGFEPDVKLQLGFFYNRDLFIKTFINYSYFISEQSFPKLCSGINLDYSYYILLPDRWYRNYLQFSVGADFNKYYFENSSIDFFKLNLNFKYIFLNFSNFLFY